MTNPGENPEYHKSTTGHTMSSADWLDIHFLPMPASYLSPYPYIWLP